MSWIDELVPPSAGHNLVLDSMDRVTLRDSGTAINLGPVDRASLGLLYEVLHRPGLNLHLRLPRGRHDVAILFGLFAQLVRRVAWATGRSQPEAFNGPAVVIGMDTLVHERLRRIRMANVPLADGLNACRLRYDGRLIDIQGNATACRPSDQPLIYLNTRVGWPALSSGVRAGAVIIDRTSFASGEIFDRALAWAERHQAGTVIVLADVGDEMTARAVEASGRRFIAWPWIAPLVDHVGWELGRPTSTSPLSTNPLLHQANEGPKAIVFPAPAVDELFRSAIAGVARARRIDASLPRPLVVARRLLNGLSQCFGSLSNYNQWAALDHRSTTLSSLRRELEDSRGSRLGGVWSTFAETRWASLRLDLLELYELLYQENPKLFTLAFAVGHLRGDRPDTKLIIRTPQ